MSKIKPKKWTELYSVGTVSGNEEALFFKSLARHPKYTWRSVAALAKESGLSIERTNEIISKYSKINVIFQNPKNEDHWGYWERVPHMLPDQHVSICEADKMKRVERFINKD